MHVVNYIARNDAVMLESENKCKSFDPIHLRYKQSDNIIRNYHQTLQLVHVFCKVTLIKMVPMHPLFTLKVVYEPPTQV